MTMPGAPCVYYGTEIGMTGATDPYSRAAFLWDEPEGWNHELLDFFKRAIALRHAHPILRTGKVRTLYADHGVYACMRETGIDETGEVDETACAAVIVYNTRTIPLAINLNQVGARYEGTNFRGVWNDTSTHQVEHGALHNLDIPARDAVVLVQER
jgi:neopullulanase